MPNIIYNIFGNYFDKSNYENRSKSSKPTLSVTNINNYPLQYEKYFNDFLPFRNELVKLKNIQDIFIFKNLFSDKVILGKDNWLFYKPFPLINDFIGIYEFTDEELEIARNNLINFRDKLKNKNIDFVLMICPNKNLIYEEKMPDYIKRKTKINSTDKFIEYMEENTDIKIVYPKNEILKYKNKYQLYYKYDTHWSTLGAYIGYSELMKKLNMNYTSIDNLIVSNLGKGSGDLAGMINFLKFYSDDNYYTLNSFTSNDYRILSGVKHYYNSGYCESDSNNTNNILMVRDSFTTAMFDYIAASFSKSSFIHIDNFNNKEIINNKPNILVFETVERDLKRYLLYKIPSYKIE